MMFSEQSPALVAARADEALTHGQVLYGLIKPTKDMEEVESTAAMVNVIPKKRIYVMDKLEELDLFTAELFKRPLVVQPSAHIGRGLAAISCTMFTKEEKWIVLVNQAHPKINGRIRMGVDVAKQRMIRGEPFILKLSLNTFLKRIYLDRLTKAALDPRFTFIEFEDAEIQIRFRGDAVHRSMKWEFKNPPISFEFDDLLPREIVRRTVTAAQTEWSSPALRVIKPDEIGQYLPGWNFEQFDPLAEAEAEAQASAPPPSYEEGAVGGEEPPPAYSDLREPAPAQGRIVGRAQRKAASSGAKYSVPVELHVPEPDGPQILHRGDRTPSPASPLRSRTYNDPYISSPSSDRDRFSPSPRDRGHYKDLNQRTRNEHQYEDYNVRKVGQGAMSRSPKSPYGEQGIGRQDEQYSMAAQSPRSPGRNTDNYRQYPISPVIQEIKQPAKSTYLVDDEEDDGGFSPSHRSRTPQMSPANYANTRNLPQPQRPPRNNNIQRLSPSPRNDNYNRDLERPTPSPRGTGPSSGQPVAPPRGFHRHQGSGRSESGSDSGFGESDNHLGGFGSGRVAAKVPYYNHAYEKDSPEKEQSMDDILAKHKALAAQMFQQTDQTDQGHSDRVDRNDYQNHSDYNQELQKWRQNINNLEDAYRGPENNNNYSRSRSQTSSQGQEVMGESFI